MGVTAVAELAAVPASGNLKEEKQDASDFSEVLGKTMDAGKTAGRTPESNRTRSREANQEDDKPKSKQSGSKQADSQNANEQSIQGTVCIIARTALTASGAAVAAYDPMTAPSGEVTGAVDTGKQQTVNSCKTEQAVKMILAELGRKGEEIQNALTAPYADQTRLTAGFQAAVTAENIPSTEQAPATEILATDEGTTEVASAILGLGTKEKPANTSPNASSQAASAPPVDTAVPTVTDPGTADQDLGQGGESGAQGTESTENMGEKEKLPSLPTDNQMVQANFRTQIDTRARSQVEMQELSAAVDRALERFQADFQGIKTESSTIRIALEPKELGLLTITLASGASGVTAKIRTDNPEAANLIGDQVNRMIQSMEAKGVRVENVDVTYGGTASQDFSGGGGNNTAQQYGGSAAANLVHFFAQAAPGPTDVLQNYESGTGYYAAEDGVGESVEYRV